MTTFDKKAYIEKWLDHALNCEQMKHDGFDSIDIAELVGEEFSNDEIVAVGLEFYQILLDQYLSLANEYRAELYFTLEYSEKLNMFTFDELLNNKLTLRQPPELYLVKREPVFEKYVLEEYKKAFTTDKVKVSQGVLYSYYQSICDDDDSYAHNFVLQHHLKNSVQEIGKENYSNVS